EAARPRVAHGVGLTSVEVQNKAAELDDLDRTPRLSAEARRGPRGHRALVGDVGQLADGRERPNQPRERDLAWLRKVVPGIVEHGDPEADRGQTGVVH